MTAKSTKSSSSTEEIGREDFGGKPRQENLERLQRRLTLGVRTINRLSPEEAMALTKERYKETLKYLSRFDTSENKEENKEEDKE